MTLYFTCSAFLYPNRTQWTKKNNTKSMPSNLVKPNWIIIMAKILSYFHLCPINDEEEFLGLSRDQTKGNVINTLGKNIIINVKVRTVTVRSNKIPTIVIILKYWTSFQLSNQKQITSWTALDKLSSKVIYDFNSKEYVGLFARKWIRCWTADCSDINKIKKIKVCQVFGNLSKFAYIYTE